MYNLTDIQADYNNLQNSFKLIKSA
jgi:hypothetical protein